LFGWPHASISSNKRVSNINATPPPAPLIILPTTTRTPNTTTQLPPPHHSNHHTTTPRPQSHDAPGEDDRRGCLLVVCSGTLAVRLVTLPPPPPPRFDDGSVLRDAQDDNDGDAFRAAAAAAAASGGAEGGLGTGGSGALSVKVLGRVGAGEVVGEGALFGHHERFPRPARARHLSHFGVGESDVDDSGDSGGGGGGASELEEPLSAEEVVVPTSAGEGCTFWVLPRRLLGAMRTSWALEDEAERVAFLRGVPALGSTLSEVQLQRVAALAEEVRTRKGFVSASIRLLVTAPFYCAFLTVSPTFF